MLSRKYLMLALSLFLFASAAPGTGAGLKYYPDDPIWNDPDSRPIARPSVLERSELYDFLQNTFSDPGQGKGLRSRDINTVDEVPDSSWFTNRMGRYRLSAKQLTTVPGSSSGPDMSAPWTVTKMKTQGVSPGCVIKDRKGDVYFIKFDPPEYPGLATSAELISTMFFHAFGYNVPDNYIVSLGRNQLKPDPSHPLVDADLDRMLTKAARAPDGKYRALASRRIPGESIGYFSYYGRRSDDPNDLYNHEDRRELRALRVFASWLNHYDIKVDNTLDVYLPDRKFVKHYLLDFGSTLGSRGVAPQSPQSGHEYLLDWHPMLKSAITLGLWTRPWQNRPPAGYPEVGRFDADLFDPPLWKPIYPNPAFERMRSDDAFWAARIISRFTEQDISAIVHAAHISDPEAENYLTQTLLARRQKILACYMSQVNPLSDFELSLHDRSLTLTFRNPGVEAGVGEVQSYQVRWFRFDNRSGELTPLGRTETSKVPALRVPSHPGAFATAEIRTLSPDQSGWMKKVTVTIRMSPEPEIVGVEREV